MLRFLRIFLAVVIFIPLTFHFLDFNETAPSSWRHLEQSQFIPSIIAGASGIILVLVLLTLLFGRIYCSTLCPLGVLQDCVSWLAKKFNKKKKYSYSPAKTDLRLLFLVLALLPLAAGLITGLLWLDPYSIFGRIAVNVFAPIYNFGNNIIYGICKFFNINKFYHVGIYWQAVPATIVGLAYFGLIFCLAWRFGRIWCNAVCPVGTVLGLLSKHSVFKIKIDKSKCSRCGLCAARCKSSCIDSKGQEVDSSRCVDCFNCLGACRQKAISWSFALGSGSNQKTDQKENSEKNSSVKQDNADQVDSGKREFLTVMALLSTAAVTAPVHAAGEKIDEIKKSAPAQKSASAADAPKAGGTSTGKSAGQATEKSEKADNKAAVKDASPAKENSKTKEDPKAKEASQANGVKNPQEAQKVSDKKAKKSTGSKAPDYGKTPFKRKYPITPPGSTSLSRFNELCTACHLCVNKCPANILRPSTLEYGLKGFLQPRVDFTRGFCNYDCTICCDVCPNNALEKLTQEEKHRNQMGRVVFIKENCIVYAEETSCGACSEHCPTQAVAMVPYKGDELTIPEINPDICVGCGGCEFICPARPYRAIYVEGNPNHLIRKEIKIEKKKEVKIDDFGF